MFSNRPNAGSTAAKSIAALLIVAGFWLDAVWFGGTGRSWLWGGFSLIVLLLSSQPVVCQRLAGLAARYLGNPWLWLGLALAVNGLVLIAGQPEYGGLRQFGGFLRIRASLWSLLFYSVFLVLFCQLTVAGVTAQLAAVIGTGLLALSMLVQPDIFPLLLLVVVGVLIGRKARHAGRFWLPAGHLLVSLLLIYAVIGSYSRGRRLLAYLTQRFDDPTGLGFEALTLRRAMEQGSWWGLPDGVTHSAMAVLPKSSEWYSLAYLGVWLGQAAVLLFLALLIAYGYLIFQLGRQAVSPVQQSLVQAGLVIFALDSVAATAGSYGLMLNGHYGMAFLSGGQMSLAAVLLLAVASYRRTA